MAVPELSSGISPPTFSTTYELFKPSNSELRQVPSYYRGCWHEVSRTFLFGYSHFLPRRKSFTTQRPSSLTRHRCIRVSPIVQDSLLLPPVGVWAVSQSQCGCTSVKTNLALLAFYQKILKLDRNNFIAKLLNFFKQYPVFLLLY